MAGRLLAMVPRVTMPDVPITCDLPVCQVRIVREASPDRHERYGDLRQDRVLDSSGAFWCATRDDRAAGQIATLRVEQGRISEPDARRVFAWVAGTIDTNGTPSQGSSAPALDSVMVRRRGANWARLAEPTALGIRERWNRMAARLPDGCRPAS
jgi:hypothetical protein